MQIYAMSKSLRFQSHTHSFALSFLPHSFTDRLQRSRGNFLLDPPEEGEGGGWWVKKIPRKRLDPRLRELVIRHPSQKVGFTQPMANLIAHLYLGFSWVTLSSCLTQVTTVGMLLIDCACHRCKKLSSWIRSAFRYAHLHPLGEGQGPLGAGAMDTHADCLNFANMDPLSNGMGQFLIC